MARRSQMAAVAAVPGRARRRGSRSPLNEAAQPGAAVALLRAAGCEEQLDRWNKGWVSRKVENPATDLPRVRKVIGRLQLAGKELVNARRRLVEVTLRAADYPSVHVRYETRMPRRKRCGRPPRCRIVTQVRRVSRLVCETTR